MFTKIGTGIYLTPSDAAMSREHLKAWLAIRGVRPDEMAEALTANAGRTEAEMDADYEACHGDMA